MEDFISFRLFTPDAFTATLSARLVYSWLAYRAHKEQGDTVRAIAETLGMDWTTANSALKSLGSLVEYRGGKWFALEPLPDMFKPRSFSETETHWADRLHYLTVRLPERGAKLGKRRFGINHAMIYSYLASEAKKRDGVVFGFTKRGAGSKFGIGERTIYRVLTDLADAKLVSIAHKGRSFNVTVPALNDETKKIFQAASDPKPEPKPKPVQHTWEAPKVASAKSVFVQNEPPGYRYSAKSASSPDQNPEMPDEETKLLLAIGREFYEDEIEPLLKQLDAGQQEHSWQEALRCYRSNPKAPHIGFVWRKILLRIVEKQAFLDRSRWSVLDNAATPGELTYPNAVRADEVDFSDPSLKAPPEQFDLGRSYSVI